MHPAIILRILGVLLMVFSFTMIPPVIVSLIYKDGQIFPFLGAFALILVTGMICWLPFHKRHAELRVRDGFLIVVMFWFALGLSGSVPLLLDEALDISVTDAVFESLSGLTTTGATVITGLDHLPRTLLFYRQQLQWLGGMGIIVLAVAILPMLGIGGMQLYRAETPGPVKDSKIAPRITETAKALWYLYLSMTFLCATAYWLAGMDTFDAICHAFSTIAIGGFSTHDASIGYFNSPTIEAICIVFMLLAAINFSLHFLAWRRRSVLPYWRDPELRFFILTLAFIILGVLTGLWLAGTYDSLSDTVRYGVFEAVSIMTTTGFGTADFAHWPSYLPILLLLSSFTGGCAGSTAGGMKAIRTLLIVRQGIRELRRLVHPNAILSIKLGKHAVPDRVIEAVWGFAAVYLLCFATLTLAVMATGLDFETAMSAVAACLNNLGPGLGAVHAHYGNINDVAKWFLCFAMLLGRLEIFTLLVLFMPMFWRR